MPTGRAGRFDRDLEIALAVGLHTLSGITGPRHEGLARQRAPPN
jgi:hypothetical protein